MERRKEERSRRKSSGEGEGGGVESKEMDDDWAYGLDSMCAAVVVVFGEYLALSW